MAKKIKVTGPAAETRPAAWRGWFPVFLVVAVVAGGAGAFFWHQHGRIGSALARLPILPDVSDRPAELARLLKEAQGRALAEHGSLESVAALGRIYQVNGLVTEAGACWTYLHEVDPNNARWCYYLADLSHLTADETSLRSWLEQTVKLAPDYAPAWLELAELEFKTGRLESAAHVYGQRNRLVPGDPYASLGLARIALQQDRRAEGKRLIEELIKQVPEFPSSHNIYAEILAQEGDQVGAANQRWLGTVAGRFRAAADPWKEELRPWCCDVDQLIVWGAIDLQTKQGDRGKQYFERAIRIDPQNQQGYENLGMHYLEMGEPAKAAEILEQGSILPHASELLYMYLGDAYLAMREPMKALQVAERGLSLMPNSSRFHNTRGLALAASERLDEALQAYRAAIACSPGSPDPVANLGLTLLRQGHRDEGMAALKQALELQPGFTKAATNLAYLELEAGNLPAAAKYVFPYFQQFPGLNSARSLMSRYYLLSALDAARRGDLSAVENACVDGLGIVPTSPELNGFLGVHYLQQGRATDALKFLEISYRLQPADPRVALSLADLYIQLGRGTEARTVLNATAEGARERNDANVGNRVAEMLRRIP